MTEDEVVWWHQRLNGHEYEQTAGDTEGQGTAACFSPWGRKESDMTEQQPPAEGQDPVGRHQPFPP